MSRYTVKFEESKEFVYGWDHALGYFYEVWDYSKGKEDYEHIVEDKSYFLNNLKKEEMILKMENYGAKRDHIENLAADVPF